MSEAEVTIPGWDGAPIDVVTDCRLSDSQPWVIAPSGCRPSNPSPVAGCDCTACTNGREYLSDLRARLRRL